MLNHRQSATRGGVLGVYQRSGRWPEQVKAMQLWGKLLDAAIEGRDDDTNVVPITAHAGWTVTSRGLYHHRGTRATA